ncbi:hypothetical protein WA556_001381 [Blastocystis sp. ATCC 50177/Nand II]
MKLLKRKGLLILFFLSFSVFVAVSFHLSMRLVPTARAPSIYEGLHVDVKDIDIGQEGSDNREEEDEAAVLSETAGDRNEMRDTIKEFNSKDDYWKADILYPMFGNHLWVYQGMTEIDFPRTPLNFNATSYPSYNFTVVCAFPYSEMAYLSALIQMWPSFISVSVFKPTTTVLEDINTAILTLRLPSRVRLVLVDQPEGTYTDSFYYPVNYLRDLAIQNCITTHYIVVDSGTLLSPNLHAELTRLTDAECGTKVALILPLFFPSTPTQQSQQSQQQSQSQSQQSQQSQSQQDCRHRKSCILSAWHNLPPTPRAVRGLLLSGHLSTHAPTAAKHDYVFLDWTFLPPETHSLRLACFDSLLQQPFVVVRHAADVPGFDRRFVGRGFNRVQQVEHLRLRGFEFRLIAHAFGEMLPREAGEGSGLLRGSLGEGRGYLRGSSAMEEAMRMKYLFMVWYSEVKDTRSVNRTRMCSEKERARRKAVINKLLLSASA